MCAYGIVSVTKLNIGHFGKVNCFIEVMVLTGREELAGRLGCCSRMPSTEVQVPFLPDLKWWRMKYSAEHRAQTSVSLIIRQQNTHRSVHTSTLQRACFPSSAEHKQILKS